MGILEIQHCWNGAQIRQMDDKLYTEITESFIGIDAGSQSQFYREAYYACIFMHSCLSSAFQGVKNGVCSLAFGGMT
jgi:hypothetical protein